jgi:hypothetical protein
MTRVALKRFWTPVGAGLMEESEVKHMSGFLFGGDEGHKVLDRIDRQVDRLPGLAGLSLATTAADKLLPFYDEAEVQAQLDAHVIDLTERSSIDDDERAPVSV